MGITLEVSFFAALVGLFLGMLVALMRLSGVKPLQKIAGVYVGIIRGTPMLLQVLIINFGIFGSIAIDRVIIGVIACGLNSGAYVSEIIRSGILSVDKGQTEAGRSLGLSNWQTMPGRQSGGKGNADIFIGGRYIAGYWVREDTESPTVFYDDQGNELQFTRGKTYIANFPPEALLTFTGVE